MMELNEKLQVISDRIKKTKDSVKTEEATKNAFVMPFISALGYDVFNPIEVVPEFIADIGSKKGEKVDYCIFKDGMPTIIIECKHWEEDLDNHTSQLFRYYHTTSARFGIITNGIVYRFYSDLEEYNKMDKKPFFEFSFEKISENISTELKKFEKSNFDVDEIVNTASDLKYSKLIRDLLASELKDPTEDFTKFFASRVYNGKVTKKVLDQFVILVQKSCKQLLSEIISDRLKSALHSEEEDAKKAISEVDEEALANQPDERGIITTEEEIEGFRIVQAILRRKIGLDRVHVRDTKSYFGVLFDDNNRKPLCRLHFNASIKYLGVFDPDKKETRIPLDKLEDIYEHEDKLLETLEFYNN